MYVRCVMLRNVYLSALVSSVREFTNLRRANCKNTPKPEVSKTQTQRNDNNDLLMVMIVFVVLHFSFVLVCFAEDKAILNR